mmetsp:Transcript_5448/g.12805  ORF Transcript_5448/g.12805 Transcript_5448/m.12805 type:complete len:105 (+) Transcript_5448:268-582(+)
MAAYFLITQRGVCMLRLGKHACVCVCVCACCVCLHPPCCVALFPPTPPPTAFLLIWTLEVPTTFDFPLHARCQFVEEAYTHPEILTCMTTSGHSSISQSVQSAS